MAEKVIIKETWNLPVSAFWGHSMLQEKESPFSYGNSIQIDYSIP